MAYKIAVDVYGGDKAPDTVISGALNSIQESDADIVFVGKEKEIVEKLKMYEFDKKRVSIVNAEETVSMFEKPSLALRKKDSSMSVGIKLVKNKNANAFVTAGNSGAAMAISMFDFGRIKGVTRPAIATLLPTLNGSVLLLDAGANVDCKPYNLLEFAIMGAIYVKYMVGIKKPKIGLLSNGSEPGKGNKLVIESYDLFSRSSLNFIGNIEGDDIYTGKADVVVCDGFVGNVVLKTSESLPEVIAKFLKSEIKKSLWYKIGFLLAKPAFRLLARKVDYAEFGGAPLLGVNGNCVIGHGRSNAKAIKNAILKAVKFSQLNINDKIEKAVANCIVLQKCKKAVEF